ncbi:MAG: hypothetical protein JOZ45_05380 [Acidobacteriaceae bacterium]|nr:hypothetical protein [Acidobacteriaceae bacterium]MBV9305544.1 hypothetical protein [Acidobacteriaceae bacterium]
MINFAEPVRPWAVLGQMPSYVFDQIAHPFASMVAGDFVVQIAEAALDGISTKTISRQKQQLKRGCCSSQRRTAVALWIM